MGNALHGLSWNEICCSKHVTDIGEQWKLSQRKGKNEQLKRSWEKCFEVSLKSFAFFNILASIGILVLGLCSLLIFWKEIHMEYFKSESDFVQQIRVVPGLLIFLGIFIFFISILGIDGVRRHQLPFLITYAIFLFAYIVVQMICIIVVLTTNDRISDQIYHFFSNESIVSYQVSHESSDLHDIMGSDKYGYLDWTANKYYRCSSDNLSSGKCKVPFSCCIGASMEFDDSEMRSFCNDAVQTLSLTDAGKIVHTGGCAKATLNTYQKYSGIVVVVLCCAIPVEIILAVMITFLIRDVFDEIDGYKQWQAAKASNNPERKNKAKQVEDQVIADQGCC